ncbi:hypothetical protein C8Q76DRAFT_648414, partial [Earliella scabrosa]
MPPPPLNTTDPTVAAHPSGSQSARNTTPFFDALRGSWRSPEDILTLLMLIGGDIVQRAVAQLALTGPGPFTPVAFSFGWLAYAVCALTSALGDGRLMPEPDYPLNVVNVETGYLRENKSWVLGRLMRDHEQIRADKKGLIVAFFEVKSVGDPARDWVYWCGVVTILVQLSIALIPGLLHGDWLVLIVTGGGTILALIGGGLNQWREEKYPARPVKKNKRDVICLHRGNGTPCVIVLISDGVGLRVEDLAGGRREPKNSMWTSFATAALCVLWVVLLLTVEGIDGDAWYMLAIGGLGMAQNVLAAGVRRSAAALGFYFRNGDIPSEESKAKVMETLLAAEEREPGVGCVLLDIFFPGGLRVDEQEIWSE